ncbi:bidirectional sugar transporter SWEET14 [Daucus carota subsp. sativus]|uniref:bidirectional sugar transporter SWEET14 n=1 Tax=Daucus carota subsp. sativus TaxID=79200 RepID=UPI0007EF9AE9|nr:PREDICTED: bidirectional sugar transporter SWEET14-like [Daucus carota subsp. sativus]
MALLSAHWTLVFGVLGNVVSFAVFLAPIPTFHKVDKKKATEGFQSVPYVVALFSAMLWIYYALLKSNTLLLITINSAGCVLQTIYISIFLIYAPPKARIQTLELLVSTNVVGFGLIVILAQFAAKGAADRVAIVGWICLIFSVCVFVAPLCIVRQVMRTKSVEYMPFLLSLFLTLSAVMWFFYGLLLKDYNIALPNVLGFTFGILQMVLYMVYKNTKKNAIEPENLPELAQDDPVIIIDDKNLPELKAKIDDVMRLSAMVTLTVDKTNVCKSTKILCTRP